MNKWTSDEDKQMLELVEQGKHLAEVAHALGRTENAIRNRLYELRKGKKNSEARPFHVHIEMTAAEYNNLVKGAEAIQELKRLESFSEAMYNDYVSLYRHCEELLKAYKNHRNTKALFKQLQEEMEAKFPCPF